MPVADLSVPIDVSVAAEGGSRGTVARSSPYKLRRPLARTALRSATLAIHDRMHDHPALASLAAGTIGWDDYRRVLAHSYGFYSVAEPVLCLAGGLAGCLREDLTELGMTEAAIAGLPRCTSVDIGRDHAELIGAQYVILGASLGGKVMARAIAGRTDGGAAMPVRFLTGMGENHWKTFAAELEANLPDADSRSRAARAARAMFATYEDWMAGCE